MVARTAWLLLLLPGMLGSVAAVGADEPLVLRVGERRPELRDGLQHSADGTVWITLHDAEQALHLRAKRLIPRPPAGKRPVARQERDDWVLCDAGGCTTYGGTLLGTTDEPAFDLERLTRPLGYRMTRKEGEIHLRPTTKREPRTGRGHLGNLAPDLTLRGLDGTLRGLRRHAGRRVLLVTWAPWSPTRDLLQAWAAHHKQRAARKLDLWLAALDIEGAARVKDFVDTGFDPPILLDRNADLARTLPMKDAGHWYLIDELGLLRADGESLDAVALQWIDLHLDEALAEPLDAAPAAPAAPAEEGTTREQAALLVAAHPNVPAYAFRLAALHLDAGDVPAALAALDEARRRTPGAWYLRKQYWALWQPNRYYAGAIDLAWQKAQAQRERDELDHPKRRRRTLATSAVGTTTCGMRGHTPNFAAFAR